MPQHLPLVTMIADLWRMDRFKTDGQVAVHRGSSMATGEVEYKCTFCGNMESFTPEMNGISCKGCGSRIFMKARRSGYKTLDAV